MHSGGGARTCKLAGTCDQPTVALASLMMIPGVLPERVVSHAGVAHTLIDAETPALLAVAVPIDSPPPRA
jgi:hypothetical protein